MPPRSLTAADGAKAVSSPKTIATQQAHAVRATGAATVSHASDRGRVGEQSARLVSSAARPPARADRREDPSLQAEKAFRATSRAVVPRRDVKAVQGALADQTMVQAAASASHLKGQLAAAERQMQAEAVGTVVAGLRQSTVSLSKAIKDSVVAQGRAFEKAS